MEEADFPSSKGVLLILESVLTPKTDSLGGKIQIKNHPLETFPYEAGDFRRVTLHTSPENY